MAVAPAVSNGLSRSERESMLTSVENMVKGEVLRAKITPSQREDVEQELRMLLWQVSEKYDPNRGVKWSTFAYSCMGNFLLAWNVKHHDEKYGGLIASFSDRDIKEQIEQLAVAPESHEPEDEPDEIGEQAGGMLANAVRRKLAEGILNHLTEGHRRLVERVAFDGLTAAQIAEQDGQPVKVVKTNIKGALRKLCKLGLVDHVASDETIASATAPLNPAHSQKNRAWERARTDAAIVADLESVSTADAFAVVLAKLDADMRVIVTSLIDRTFTVDEVVELMGGDRKVVVNRLKKTHKAVVVRKGANVAQVDRGELIAR